MSSFSLILWQSLDSYWFQVATTAFYKAGNLAEAMVTFDRQYGGNVNGFIKGLRVKTLHVCLEFIRTQILD